jgi:hypothetical protein
LEQFDEVRKITAVEVIIAGVVEVDYPNNARLLSLSGRRENASEVVTAGG